MRQYIGLRKAQAAGCALLLEPGGRTWVLGRVHRARVTTARMGNVAPIRYDPQPSTFNGLSVDSGKTANNYEELRGVLLNC